MDSRLIDQLRLIGVPDPVERMTALTSLGDLSEKDAAKRIARQFLGGSSQIDNPVPTEQVTKAQLLAKLHGESVDTSDTPPAQPTPVLARGTLEDSYTDTLPNKARGSLEELFEQPASSGPSVTNYFKVAGQGASLTVRVARELTNADVRQQTDQQGQPLRHPDGRPKFVATVPVKVVKASDPAARRASFPKDAATLWLKGHILGKLTEAMREAGESRTQPPAGSFLTLIYKGVSRGSGYYYDSYAVEYRKP